MIDKTSPLIDQLGRHEGFRSRVYKCTAGFDTIGYGYCIDKNPLGISYQILNQYRNYGMDKKTAAQLLEREVERLEHELSGKLPWWSKLGKSRQEALLNMAYNLGVNGLLKFKWTLFHLKHGQYDQAADEMLRSNWAKQVGDRAFELARQIESGVYS
ncbi:MAG: glycoside hydrolase family protein [Methylophilus sp.]